jgi:hypothetical protein
MDGEKDQRMSGACVEERANESKSEREIDIEKEKTIVEKTRSL